MFSFQSSFVQRISVAQAKKISAKSYTDALSSRLTTRRNFASTFIAGAVKVITPFESVRPDDLDLSDLLTAATEITALLSQRPPHASEEAPSTAYEAFFETIDVHRWEAALVGGLDTVIAHLNRRVEHWFRERVTPYAQIIQRVIGPARARPASPEAAGIQQWGTLIGTLSAETILKDTCLFDLLTRRHGSTLRVSAFGVPFEVACLGPRVASVVRRAVSCAFAGEGAKLMKVLPQVREFHREVTLFPSDRGGKPGGDVEPMVRGHLLDTCPRYHGEVLFCCRAAGESTCRSGRCQRSRCPRSR